MLVQREGIFSSGIAPAVASRSSAPRYAATDASPMARPVKSSVPRVKASNDPLNEFEQILQNDIEPVR
jgi:hypothetical protein